MIAGAAVAVRADPNIDRPGALRGDGQVEMIRSLRVARATAMKARTQAINALKALVVTAPEELREQLRGLSTVSLVRAAARFEPGAVTTPMAAGKLARRFPDRGPPQARPVAIASTGVATARLTRPCIASW